jgi:hypothetical protein
LSRKNPSCSFLEDNQKRQHVIGRALVVLFANQTDSEKVSETTFLHNNVGFTSADAYWGSVNARDYVRNKTLNPRAIMHWMKFIKNTTTPRICKYWKQLNTAAEKKAQGKLV